MPDPAPTPEPVVEAPVAAAPPTADAIEAAVSGVSASLDALLPPPPEPLAAGAPPAPTGEFAVPPAPPMGPQGPSTQPVTPGVARPAPRIDITPDMPNLPTRAPGSNDVDGPDRIAQGLTAGTEPSALSAALAAFDTPHTEIADDLPSRDPDDAPIHLGEDPTSIAPSRLDPEAFRERLRSFQSEYSTGRDLGDDQPDNHTDLGGDLR